LRDIFRSPKAGSEISQIWSVRMLGGLLKWRRSIIISMASGYLPTQLRLTLMRYRRRQIAAKWSMSAMRRNMFMFVFAGKDLTIITR